MQLSVVIGTYNQKETLKIVLESLNRQSLSPQDYEVIVVDSSSADGTSEMMRSISPPLFSLIYLHQENRGKSAARNRGIKEAKSEIILLTDADMMADRSLLEEHLKAHPKYKNAVFEGLTSNIKSQLPMTNDQIMTKDQLIPYIKAKFKPFQKLKWSYFLTGNLSIRKETIISAGLFDENFTGYGWEDLELGYRLHKMRIPLIYLPTAINYHLHPLSEEDMLKRKYEMGKSAAFFYRKHPTFEIKYFLGMNPIAMGVYHYLKRNPKILKYIESKAGGSGFFRYMLEEYFYRKGLCQML